MSRGSNFALLLYKMTSIKIGGVDEHFNLPWHLLWESGRLDELEIDLQWIDCLGGTGEMTKLLREGDLDMAVLLTEGIVMDILNESPSRILKVFVQSSLEWGVHVASDSDKDLRLEDRLTYAISREGSGSHLMALVYAKEKGISINRMNFVEVGSLAGALRAFEKKEVDVFFWEKFTTDPHCTSKKLKRIDTIPTPWPCFMIAVNSSFYKKNIGAVEELVSEVLKEAAQFKKNEQAPKIVAERYGLTVERAEKWFDSVLWGAGQNLSLAEINRVVKELQLLGKVEAGVEPMVSNILV